MAQGVARPAYVRRNNGETRVEHRCNPDEVSIEDLTAVAAALKAWEKRQGTPKSKKPAAPPVWHKQAQVRIKQPLWILLARSAVADGIASGLVRRAGGDATGWEDQVLDGLSPYPRPGLA